MPRDEAVDARTLLPDWHSRERRLAHMLPYVSLVDDHTVRTRVNELFQCIRLGGINSYTTDDAHLDRVTALFARLIAQLGPEFSYYVHRVSKAITPDLKPVEGDSFAAAVDAVWREGLAKAGLRDRTLTLTVLHRPPPGSFLGFMSRSAPDRLREETRKRLRRLEEAVGVFLSGLSELKPRLLPAATGELVGFLGALNTGRELPLYPASRYGFLACDVANTRVTFREDHFELSEGVVGHRFGKSFTIGEYSEVTTCTMFDMLNLPVDMVVTQSFTPINSNLMAGRIRRQKRQMQASQDAALSLLEALDIAHDDLEARRQSFGDHHMDVTLFSDTLDELRTLGAEIVNAAAAEGVKMLGERFAARSHYFSQHPGKAKASFGAVFCEMAVDPITLDIEILRLIGAYDCGRVLQPAIARAQLRGAMIMGLGQALMEETRLDRRTGAWTNPEIGEALIPTQADVPHVEAIMVGADGLEGPLNFKGIAETAIVGVAPAIASAFRDATGGQVRALPMTHAERLRAVRRD